MNNAKIKELITSTKYKSSRWNYLFRVNNKNYIYNTLSCGFGELDDKALVLLTKIMQSESYTPSEKDVSLLTQLIQGSIVVPEKTDEINMLKFLSYKRRFSDSYKIISLTIVPTLDCNFRCSYCFQNHQQTTDSDYMSEEIQQAIIHYTDLRAKNESKRISVCWYGGEPLLASDIIERLTKRFLKIAKKYDIPYDASMVTNGYLLDEKRIEMLKKWKINDLQITIDGPREIHDRRRFLVSGKPTYDTIIQNICSITKEKEFPNVTLRVNVDVTNEHYIDDLIDDLDRNHLMDKLGVYLAPVTSTTKSCGDISKILFSSKEMIEKDIRFVKTLIDKDLVVTMHYPKMSVTQCMAVCPESDLIGPDGKLWPCWDVIGRNEESTGNIKTGHVYGDTYFKWCLWDPFQDEECLDCKVLPICMGGCPARRVPLNQEYFTAVFQKKCSRWRWGMEEYLKLIIELYQKKMSKAKTDEKK